MKKRDLTLLEYLFNTPTASSLRREYFSSPDFLMFCFYYFPNEFWHDVAELHHLYCEALEKGEDIFFVGFRECAKTVFLRYYYIYCICYKLRRFIMHYNSDHTKAKKMLLSLIMIMEKNKRIIQDFGHLYIPAEGRKQRDPTKKTISEFITTNEVMVKAMSLGMSPRGESFYAPSGETFRPDLLGFDDLDNDKNIKNAELIQDSVEFILGEVFGGVDAFAQKIFLGNVIGEDGRVPRLKEHFESDTQNKVRLFWIPIRQKGKIVWERFVATDAEAEKLNKDIVNPKAKFISLQSKRRLQGSIGYNQNFNLVAYKKGEDIIGRTLIRYWYTRPDRCTIVMGVDGALSEKTRSDAMGIVITAQYKNAEGTKYKYILGNWALKGKEKSEENYKRFIKEKYQQYKVHVVVVETQGGGLAIAPKLKSQKMAVVLLPAIKDKVQNLLEYQGDFERGEVFLAADMNKDLETQLIGFPNVDKDDLVDAMVLSFHEPKLGGFSSTAKK